MRTKYGQLTYCTNIHAGETWTDHFAALKSNVPGIKSRISPGQDFGIGLRLSNAASVEMMQPGRLDEFKQWLDQERCYVFTMNGFPYGGFHNTVVKDQVHAPDWQTKDRVDYTLRLFRILESLLPDNEEGSISTSPLTYKHWYLEQEFDAVFTHSTNNILNVIEHLDEVYRRTGRVLHLDIEPEPDGLLESGPEFISWFETYLLPLGTRRMIVTSGYNSEEAAHAMRRHLRLCYDVCHFAVGYENHREILSILEKKNILVGKIQISAALKSLIPPKGEARNQVFAAFRDFDESTYLHQVVARQDNGLKRYPDLPDALLDTDNPETKEWRSHFHVPLFVERYDILTSTQEDIREVLRIHREKLFTSHLEVETYTWEVLPKELRVPISESIIREVQWVQQFLETGK
jgi:hypothetical protein